MTARTHHQGDTGLTPGLPYDPSSCANGCAMRLCADIVTLECDVPGLVWLSAVPSTRCRVPLRDASRGHGGNRG